MINDKNESKTSKNETEEALIIYMLAKPFLPKVIQGFIWSNTTYGQDMIAVGNEKNKLKTKMYRIVVIICLC